MAKAARGTVLDILIEVLEQGGFSHQVIYEKMDPEYTSQERRFILRLSRGVIERKLELDDILAQYSKTKPGKMKPVIRNVLRMGLYQILYMDSIPNSAAVNEAVKLTRKRGLTQLSGFVNGVLRSILRDLEAGKEVQAITEEGKQNMPQWILDLWKKSYPDEYAEILSGLNQEPLLTIQVNTNRISEEELIRSLSEKELVLEKVEDSDVTQAYAITGAVDLEHLEEFQKGYFYIQDVSSMLPAFYADLKGNEMVVDLCSAPGGKSLTAAILMKDQGTIISRDQTKEKVDRIQENADRLGITSIHPQVFDGTKTDETLVDQADVVLADLPCSGLGVFNRKADIKYRVMPEDLVELQELQREILKASISYVKPGGILVYSTCTVNPGENQENRDYILENYPEFRLLREKQVYASRKQDGFYVASFQRK